MDNEIAIDSSVQSQAPIADTSSTSSATATTSAPAAAPVAEKTFTQSQTQAIAAKEAKKAAEHARNEERARYEREMQSQPAAAAPPQNMGGMQQYSPEQIQGLIRQEAYNMSRQQMANKIEVEWVSAMDAAKEADPEFAQAYDALNIEAHPHLLVAINGLDNKAAIVKDLADNPGRFATILMLANSGSPGLAQKDLMKLSASIKANQQAQSQPQVDAPLSQVKPSNIGSDNGRANSVKDFMSRFKG